MRELRDLRRGRRSSAPTKQPSTRYPAHGAVSREGALISLSTRRVPARQIAVEVQQGSLDFRGAHVPSGGGGLLEVAVGSDELVLLVPPSHPFAKRKQVSMADVAGEPVVAHNDPSPARERVLRMFEEQHITLNMVISLPSLGRHQARGGTEAWRRAVAAPLCDHRDREWTPGGRPRAGHLTQASVDARLPQRAPLACGQCVPLPLHAKRLLREHA